MKYRIFVHTINLLRRLKRKKNSWSHERPPKTAIPQFLAIAVCNKIQYFSKELIIKLIKTRTCLIKYDWNTTKYKKRKGKNGILRMGNNTQSCLPVLQQIANKKRKRLKAEKKNIFKPSELYWCRIIISKTYWASKLICVLSTSSFVSDFNKSENVLTAWQSNRRLRVGFFFSKTTSETVFEGKSW